MIRSILLFLLPTVIYIAYIYMTREEKPGAARVAGSISHFTPARLGKVPSSPARAIMFPRVYSMRPGSMRPSLKTGGT